MEELPARTNWPALRSAVQAEALPEGFLEGNYDEVLVSLAAQPDLVLLHVLRLGKQALSLMTIEDAAASGFVFISCKLFRVLGQGVSSSGSGATPSVAQQVDFAATEISAISNKMVTLLCQVRCGQKAIRPLLSLLRLVGAEHPNLLTPMHTHLLQACIASSFYSVAADFLRSTVISEISVRTTPISTFDFLSFYYFAGLVFVGVKSFEEALDCFITCFTTPADVVSAVAVQALKHAKLVSLICRHAPLSLPRYTPQCVAKYSRQQPMAAYEAIVDAFQKRDLAAMAKAVLDNSATLVSDQLKGLAGQAVAALSDHKIRELTSTYLTLSISDISAHLAAPAAQLDPRAAELHLLRLIQGGEIRARIDQQQQMVHFVDSDAPLAADDESAVAALNAQLGRFVEQTLRSADTLRAIRKKVLVSKEYIAKHSGAGGAKSHAHGSVAMSVGQGMGGRGWEDDMDIS